MHTDEAARGHDEPLTLDDLAVVRDSLNTEIARLRRAGGRAGPSPVPRWSDEVADVVDVSERIAESGYTTVLAENTSAILAECEAAIRRLDTGTYGTCEVCEGPVGRFRLLAFPRARLCLDCQRRREAAQPSGVSR